MTYRTSVPSEANGFLARVHAIYDKAMREKG
jgi:hypothetical protein